MPMKQCIYLSLALTALVACARKAEFEPAPESVRDEFVLLSPEFVRASGSRTRLALSVDTENSDSKTTLDYSGAVKKFAWNAGDGLAFMSNVQDASTPFDYQVLTYEPGGKLEVDVDAAATVSYCCWPACGSTATPAAIPFEIPQLQSQSAVGYLNGAWFPLCGKGGFNAGMTQADVTLYPLGGVLAVGVYDSDNAGLEMKKLRIYPTASTGFAGTATIDITGESRPYITSAVSESDHVQVSLVTPYTLGSVKNTSFAIKVFASLARQSYHSVTFEVEDVNGAVYRKTTGSSAILDLSTNDIVPVNLDIKSSQTRVSPAIRGASTIDLPCYAADDAGGTYTVYSPIYGQSLSAACTEGDSWISDVAISNGVLTFSVSENTASTSRVGEITLSYTGAPDFVITVTQDRKDYVELDLDSADLSVSEDVDIELTSNCSWTLTVPDYVQVSQTSGTGSVTLSLRLEEPVLLSYADSLTVTTDVYATQKATAKLWSAGNASTYIITKPGRYQIYTIRPDGTKPTHTTDNAFDWWTKTQQNIYRNALSGGTDLSKLTQNLYVFDVYGPNNQITDSSLSSNTYGAGGYGTVVFYDNKPDRNILWSVTLWETPEIHSVKIGDYTWLDRNIGAWSNGVDAATATPATYGVYYQWGRKDPFPGPNSTYGIRNSYRNWQNTPAALVFKDESSVAVVEGNNVYGNFYLPGYYSQSYLGTYIYKEWKSTSPNVGYDRSDATSHPEWFFNNLLSDQQNQSASFTQLWQDDVKTANDPCPPGYRVPSWTQMLNLINALNALTPSYPASNSNDAQYSINGVKYMLPAAGGLTYGRVVNSGYQSMYWTSTYINVDGYPACTRAKVLGQQTIKGDYNIDGAYSYDEALHAKPIRCVKIE